MNCEKCLKYEMKCKLLMVEKCTGYQPKEKPMENKVQMTEEQFDEFCDDCSIVFSEQEILRIKEKGYIHKSPVEEAEQYYKDWYNDKESNPEIVMDKMSAAIQYLKQQLKNKE